MSVVRKLGTAGLFLPSLSGLVITATVDSGVIVTLEFPPDEAAMRDGRQSAVHIALSRKQLREVGKALLSAEANLPQVLVGRA